MMLTLVTVTFDPTLGGFPPDPLGSIRGRIEQVVEHFFYQDGCPQLLLVVHHQEPTVSVSRSAGRARRPAAGTARSEAFERLRAWRNAKASREGVPPFVLLTNRQLEELVALQDPTLRAIGAIRGIGPRKLERFGEELRQVLHSAQRAESSPGPDPSAWHDAGTEVRTGPPAVGSPITPSDSAKSVQGSPGTGEPQSSDSPVNAVSHGSGRSEVDV